MRFLVFFTSICTAVVVALGCLFTFNVEIEALKPVRASAERQLDYFASWVHAVRYAKDLEYYGMQELEPASLESLVPLDKPVSWWNLNTAQVRAQLLKHPLVRDAQVERCGYWSWSCFKLSIEERKPALLAGLKDQIWILGDDGSFVSPYRRSMIQRARLQIDPASLPQVVGLVIGGDSPQLIQGRARYVAGVIKRLETATPYQVRKVSLRPNGECRVYFKRIPFPVTFGASHESEDKLESELKRFESLLKVLKLHLAEVVSMDLAFDKLAVVRFKDEASVPELQSKIALAAS